MKICHSLLVSDLLFLKYSYIYFYNIKTICLKLKTNFAYYLLSNHERKNGEYQTILNSDCCSNYLPIFATIEGLLIGLPWQMWDEENQNNSHENDCQVILLSPPAVVVFHHTIASWYPASARARRWVSLFYCPAAQAAKHSATTAGMAAGMAARSSACIYAGNINGNLAVSAGRGWWGTGWASATPTKLEIRKKDFFLKRECYFHMGNWWHMLPVFFSTLYYAT